MFAFTVSSPYTWNLSKLYTTSEVTLSLPLAGDSNGDSIVDAADLTLLKSSFGAGGSAHRVDFLAWQRGFGSANPAVAGGDAIGDGVVDGTDLAVGQTQFGVLVSATDETSAAAATVALLLAFREASWTFFSTAEIQRARQPARRHRRTSNAIRSQHQQARTWSPPLDSRPAKV